MSQYAPIALFVYNRLEHTRRTIQALRANGEAAESDVIVFSDGPKTEKDVAKIAALREAIRQTSGFRSVVVVERERNLGLAQSIITGVSDVLSRHERVIVVEDDLVTSSHFLQYMNEALDHYAGEERVASIHGYVYPVARPLPETFFLRGSDCWGWATWRSRWAMFNPNGVELLDALQRERLTDAFDLGGAFGNTSMLEDQIAGLNNSWAIRWHASTFLANRLTLYPGRSLVLNIGNDSSGTHSGTYRTYDVEFSPRPVRVGGIPVEESAVGREAFADFGRRNKLGASRGRRLVRLLKRLLGAA
jgi:hypothetical protein